MIKLENELSLNNAQTLHDFNDKIIMVGKELKKLVNKLKKNGKTIAGYGAPTKATTFMAHFDINENILDFIQTIIHLKQNLYTPITHIPIFSIMKFI